MRQLTVGESVYMVRYNGYGNSYTAGSVVKVTPSGMADVAANGTTYTTRFNKDGYEVGKEKFRRYDIDEMPFDERTALLAKEERRKNAAHALKYIKPAELNTLHADKESMLSEVKRMRDELDAAVLLVEAI